jgi:HD superfamily phosphodiesterase
MSNTIAGIVISDSALAREATLLLQSTADDLLYHHSRRVFLWGSLKAKARGLDVDPELAYVGAMFHDLGLIPNVATANQHFEIDGADAARGFLLRHDRPERDARNVWLAIALHTTPEISPPPGS